jgi:hypothetical protein
MKCALPPLVELLHAADRPDKRILDEIVRVEQVAGMRGQPPAGPS